MIASAPLCTTMPGQIYSAETLETLFQAVEIDDVVDPIVQLPDPIPLACNTQQMRRCFELCRQFWADGVHRAEIRQLAHILLRTRDLPPVARVRYKHIRARYKHLRFALVLYSARHKAPLLFRSTVAVMGHLQDAFRNRRRTATLGYGLVLRALLTWPVWAIVKREIGSIRLDDPEPFLIFRKTEIDRLRRMLESETLTGDQFHAMRKIVSRQVSFYDTLRTLEPEEPFYKMSRFLSAINGLMGDMHDNLVERAGAGEQDYHRHPVPLPEEIRQRLELLTANYPLEPQS